MSRIVGYIGVYGTSYFEFGKKKNAKKIKLCRQLSAYNWKSG